MQALAPDRVVYCGTASKSLAPGAEHDAITRFQRSNFVRCNRLDGHTGIEDSGDDADLHTAMARASAIHNILMVHAHDEMRPEAA